MSEDYPKEVQIGELTVRITRFRGLKAALAGGLVSKVMRQIPDIQEEIIEFRKEFRKKNTIVITPAMARLPRFAPLGLDAEDFKASEGGKIEFPDEPDAQTLMIHLWPKLFDMANEEIRRFFGLIAITNRDLELADDADDVDSALYGLGTKLIREGDIDELLELVVVGYEVLYDQLLKKQDRLGKLRELPFLQRLLSTRETQEPQESSPTENPTETPQSPSVSDSLPTLPVDSDGIDEPFSTASPGESFNN